MLILFDHGTPRGLARALAGHAVVTAQAKGWDRLNNGALLLSAEQAGIDLLLTTDQRIRYQQNLTGRNLAIVVLAAYFDYPLDSLDDKAIALWSSGAAGDQNPIYFQQTYDLRDIRTKEYAERGIDISNAMPRGGEGLNKRIRAWPSS